MALWYRRRDRAIDTATDPDVTVERRVEAAAEAGFSAVEHPQPFAVPARERTAALRAHDLRFAQKGEKGLAALPGREGDFRDGLARSIDYALAVGCPLVHPMAGVPAPGEDGNRVRATSLANIAFAVERAEAAGLRVLVEPISRSAVPGYYACRMEQAMELCEPAAPGRVLLLLDTFHARATGLDAVGFVRRHADVLGHVHIADHPGRHEPGTGEFDFAALLSALDERAYEGAVGFEYVPRTDTLAGLGWLAEPVWRARPASLPRTGKLTPDQQQPRHDGGHRRADPRVRGRRRGRLTRRIRLERRALRVAPSRVCLTRS